MEDKLKLYTNKDGKWLWENGQTFWAWTEYDTEYETSDFAF